MPPKSESQRRWAFATAEGKTDTAPAVGRKFLGHGVKNLPEKAKKKAKKKRKGRVAAKRGQPFHSQKSLVSFTLR